MKKKILQFKKLIIENNYDFTAVLKKINISGPLFIAKIMDLIDNELNSKTNPYYNREVPIEGSARNKIDLFIDRSLKKTKDNNYSIEDREFVVKAIEMLEISVDNYFLEDSDINKYETEVVKKKPIREDFEVFLFDFIFDKKDIQLFKKIIEKYKVEFINHFSNLGNTAILIEKTIDEMKKSDSKNEMLVTMQMLAYIFSTDLLTSKIKENMMAIIKQYQTQMKNSKLPEQLKRNIADNFEILVNSIDEYNNSTLSEESFIARKCGVNLDFNDSILNELNLLNIDKSLYVDMTKKYVFSMDKNVNGLLEDAMSIDHLENGNIRFIVYIIEPFAYLPKNGQLEKEAYERTQTIYTDNKTITMFPEVITYTDLTLAANTNKKVIAHSFLFSKSLELISFEGSFPAIINVNHNIKFSSFDKGNTPLLESKIKFLNNLKDKLKIMYPEVSSYYNYIGGWNGNNGSDILSLSEEIMNYLKIFVNNQITIKYNELDLPFIYLVSEGVADLSYLKKCFNNLENLYGLNPPIKTYYSETNTGHKSLGIADYARTTTPARNYASLLNQQFYREAVINKKRYTNKEVYLTEEKVKRICRHMNEKKLLINQFIYDSNKNDKILRMRKG